MVRFFLLLGFVGIAAGQPLDTMFVLEMYPGTEQAIGLIQPRELERTDRAGVVGFFQTAHVLQELTGNRADISKALRRAGVRVVIGFPGAVPQAYQPVDLPAALKAALGEFSNPANGGRRRAVVLLFASEDPKLGAHVEALKAALASAHARLYAVIVQRAALTPDAPGPMRSGAPPFPVLTSRLMSELAKDSGGRVFTKAWDLGGILDEARKP